MLAPEGVIARLLHNIIVYQRRRRGNGHSWMVWSKELVARTARMPLQHKESTSAKAEQDLAAAEAGLAKAKLAVDEAKQNMDSRSKE